MPEKQQFKKNKMNPLVKILKKNVPINLFAETSLRDQKPKRWVFLESESE